MELIKRVFASVSNENNKAIFRVSTLGGIVYSWHIAAPVVGHLLTWWRAIAGIFTIFIAPPLGVFMSDLYRRYVRPIIFKRKK